MRTQTLFLSPLSAALVAVAIVASACSGSGDDGSTTAADADAPVAQADADLSAAAAETDDDEPVVDDTDEAEPTDSAPPVDEPEPEPEPVASADDNRSFCATNVSGDAIFDELNFFDPAQLESGMNALSDLLARALPDAPDAIADDLATIQANFSDVQAVMAEADYDMISASAELLDRFDLVAASPEADAASDRVDAWIEANCAPELDEGESAGDDDDSEALASIFAGEDGAQRAMEALGGGGVLTALQVNCLIASFDEELMAELLSSATSAPDDQTVERLAEVFAACDIGPEAFE